MDALVASSLVEIELPRALRRSQPDVLGLAAAVLSRLHHVEINAAVRATAAAYVERTLRTPDAIQLARAEFLVASGTQLTAFVTYDKWLAEAAMRIGLPVTSPS